MPRRFVIEEILTHTEEGDFGSQVHAFRLRVNGRRMFYQSLPGRSFEGALKDAYYWATGCVALSPDETGTDRWDFTEQPASGDDFPFLTKPPQ